MTDKRVVAIAKAIQDYCASDKCDRESLQFMGYDDSLRASLIVDNIAQVAISADPVTAQLTSMTCALKDIANDSYKYGQHVQRMKKIAKNELKKWSGE